MLRSWLHGATGAALSVSAVAALVVGSWSREAEACGGCFTPPPTQPNDPGTVVAAHRMVLSVSPQQTILWDQIQYTGAPAEFAWVLPVKPGARVEIGSDAFFDVLDAATQPSVRPPRLTCGVLPPGDCSIGSVGATSSFGCAAEEAIDVPQETIIPADPVHVVSRGSAGPYETVVLHADEPDALPKWLTKHGYSIPVDIAPLIETYVAEGFDFAALRLLPSAGVQQMRPVRVVMQGAVTSLPLRMVAAGTGARTAVTLFVISEGRYAPQNFAEATMPWSLLRWDYGDGSSNFSTLRADALKNGKEFLVTYAMKDPLFGAVLDPTAGFHVRYQTTEGWTYDRIAEAYVRQAFINGETSSLDCIDDLADLAGDTRRVMNPNCDADGGCDPIDPSAFIDARALDCDAPIGSDVPLDDLSQALVGLHPRDVWLTRMEANLARESLASDLTIQPASGQTTTLGLVQPSQGANLPPTCELAKAGAALPPTFWPTIGLRRLGDLLAALVVFAFGVLLVLRRRSARLPAAHGGAA